MPEGSGDARARAVADEVTALLNASRSLLTIRRFGCKLAFFVAFAAARACLGHGFLMPLASLSMAAALLGFVIGCWRGERLDAAFYTHLDEAVWFVLLAGLAQRLGA